MQVVRNWTSGPNPIPRHDLNFELAEVIQYHVDDNRKITGATLKMASGQTIEADASTAEHIFLRVGNGDFEARHFLGIEEAPAVEAPPASLLKDRYLKALLVGIVIALLWEVLHR